MKLGIEIVAELKTMRSHIFEILEEDGVDFNGASLPYVLEKADALIFAVQELKRRMRALDKVKKPQPL